MAESVGQDDIDALLDGAFDEAQGALDELSHQAGGGGASEDERLDLLGDVELDVTIELGRTEMLVDDIVRLGPGAVVELDKLAGDPVDVYVNGQLVARGEVLVLNDNFSIRVSEIVANLDEQAKQVAAALAGGSEAQAQVAADGVGRAEPPRDASAEPAA